MQSHARAHARTGQTEKTKNDQTNGKAKENISKGEIKASSEFSKRQKEKDLSEMESERVFQNFRTINN